MVATETYLREGVLDKGVTLTGDTQSDWLDPHEQMEEFGLHDRAQLERDRARLRTAHSLLKRQWSRWQMWVWRSFLPTRYRRTGNGRFVGPGGRTYLHELPSTEALENALLLDRLGLFNWFEFWTPEGNHALDRIKHDWYRLSGWLSPSGRPIILPSLFSSVWAFEDPVSVGGIDCIDGRTHALLLDRWAESALKSFRRITFYVIRQEVYLNVMRVLLYGMLPAAIAAWCWRYWIFMSQDFWSWEFALMTALSIWGFLWLATRRWWRSDPPAPARAATPPPRWNMRGTGSGI